MAIRRRNALESWRTSTDVHEERKEGGGGTGATEVEV